MNDRDWFAALAMAGMLAKSNGPVHTAEELVGYAFAFADVAVEKSRRDDEIATQKVLDENARKQAEREKDPNYIWNKY